MARVFRPRWNEAPRSLVKLGSSFGGASLGRLLLVDDDVLCLAILGDVLEGAGYCVTLSSSPECALSHDMQTFDLAILDFDMPGCDGRLLLLRMRAASAAFPIILHSGSADSLPAETRILFSKCISKPARTQELLTAIAQFLDANALPDHCY